jgi:crotonobetainyl-CoA:carnitine CoA-transferase CaiB-like acyl-CoA transferase
MAALRAADIPVGPSLSIAEIFEDAQYEARGMIEAVDDPVHGPIRMQGVTPKLSETPGSIRQPAPLLGEHNDEVYGELLGMTVEEIAHLRAAGII